MKAQSEDRPLVDAVDRLCRIRDAHVGMSQEELSEGRVEREDVDTVARAEHHLRRAAVHAVAGSNELVALLEAICDRRLGLLVET